MKIILIKDCKDGKTNEIIEVKDGYGKNFLIKNKFGLPFNKKNSKWLQNKINKQNSLIEKEEEIAFNLKVAIEKLHIKFQLKSFNNMVHGSISKKQIIQELYKKGIKIDSHMLAHVKINKIGNTKLIINLTKKTVANLKIEVENG